MRKASRWRRSELGIDATIVMPTTTPSIKVDAVAALGARGRARRRLLRRRERVARAICAKRAGCAFVHPFDDPDVIAGQGTIAHGAPAAAGAPLDAIFVPVGGGGLIARHRRVREVAAIPRCGSSASSPTTSACMAPRCSGRARHARPRRHFRRRRGRAARRRAKRSARARGRRRGHARRAPTRSAPRSRTSSTTRASIVEPAGALAVAGLKRWRRAEPARDGRTLVAINSGANMNFDRLRHVAERAELGEHREAILAVTIPERPGAFLRVLRGARPAQRHRVQLPLRRRRARRTSSSASRSRRGEAKRSELLAALARRGYPGARPDRQRDRQAARAPHGRRPRAGARERAPLSLRVPGAARARCCSS